MDRDDDMLATLPQTAVKIPMRWASERLEELCELIDNAPGAEIESNLQMAFELAVERLAECVDRRITFASKTKSAIQEAKEARDAWVRRVRVLEFIEERFREFNKNELLLNPAVAHRGRLGTISLQKAAPALKLMFTEKLSPAVIDNYAIPGKYVVVETIYSLNKEALRDDLRAGQTMDWASLEQSTYAMIRSK